MTEIPPFLQRQLCENPLSLRRHCSRPSVAFAVLVPPVRQAGVQKTRINKIKEIWMPASAGMTLSLFICKFSHSPGSTKPVPGLTRYPGSARNDSLPLKGAPRPLRDLGAPLRGRRNFLINRIGLISQTPVSDTCLLQNILVEF